MSKTNKKQSGRRGIGYCCPLGPEIVAIGFNHGTTHYIVSYNVTVMDSFLAISDWEDKSQVISLPKVSIVRFANAVKLALADYKTIMRDVQEESMNDYLEAEQSETPSVPDEKSRRDDRANGKILHEVCQQAAKKSRHQIDDDEFEIILASSFNILGVVYCVEIIRRGFVDVLRLSKDSHSRQAIAFPMTDTSSLEISLNSIMGIQFAVHKPCKERLEEDRSREAIGMRGPGFSSPKTCDSNTSDCEEPESETLSEESQSSDESHNSSSSDSDEEGSIDLDTNDEGSSVGSRDSGETVDEHMVFVQSVQVLDNNSFKVSFLHENSRYVVTVPSKTATQFYFAVIHASRLGHKDL